MFTYDIIENGVHSQNIFRQLMKKKIQAAGYRITVLIERIFFCYWKKFPSFHLRISGNSELRFSIFSSFGGKSTNAKIVFKYGKMLNILTERTSLRFYENAALD